MLLAATSVNAQSIFNNRGVIDSTSSALTSASTVGGSPTQIQYNNAGSFGGISGSSVAASGAVSFSTVGVNTGLQVKGNINDYLEFNVQNTNAGASASSDLTATADNGTSSTVYVDMGINGSSGGVSPFTGANAAYLYTDQNMLNLGALGPQGAITFNVSGSTAAPIEAARIVSSGNVGIGTTAPSNKLEVVGNISASTANMTSVTIGPTAGPLIRFSGFSGTNLTDLQMQMQAGGNVRVAKNTGTVGVYLSPGGGPAGSGGVWVGGGLSTASVNPSFTLQIVSGGAGGGTASIASGTIIGNGNSTALASSTLHVVGTILGTAQVSFTGLATSTPTGAACIVGNGGLVSSSTAGCIVSDPRLKKEIQLMRPVLASLMKLDAVEYNKNGHELGLIAYDWQGLHGVEALFPELVGKFGDGYKNVNYQQFTAVLLKGLQEQQAEIERLRVPVVRETLGQRLKWLFLGD